MVDFHGPRDFGAREVDKGPTQSTDLELWINDPYDREHDQTTLTDIVASLGQNRPSPDFDITSNTCSPGAFIDYRIHCHIQFAFDPTSVGNKTAVLRIQTLADNYREILLAGVGTQTTLSLTPDRLSFGGSHVLAGGIGPLTSTLRNDGTSNFTVGAVTISGNSDFYPVTTQSNDCRPAVVLVPGAHCDLRAGFDASGLGPEYGSITVTGAGGVVKTLQLDGTALAPDAGADPGYVDFGSQSITGGRSATKTVDLRNTGTAILVPDALTTITGPDAGQFAIVSDGCPVGVTLLNPGETCPVTVAFDPDTVGNKTASVVFTTNGLRTPNPSVPLQGIATRPAARLAPDLVGFGAQRVDLGPAPPQALSFKSTGDSPISIGGLSIAGADSREFSVDSADCGAASVLPGSACNVVVRFDPTTPGDKSATLNVDTEAGRLQAQLTGTGLAAPVPTPDPDPQTCDGETAGIVGTDGNDVLHGTAGPDIIAALGGNDKVLGLGGNDLVCGGAGNDRLFGGSGNDRLLGEAGKDLLSGGNGKDTLVGGPGGDTLRGGPGKDRLRGGAGKNTLKP